MHIYVPSDGAEYIGMDINALATARMYFSISIIESERKSSASVNNRNKI